MVCNSTLRTGNPVYPSDDTKYTEIDDEDDDEDEDDDDFDLVDMDEPEDIDEVPLKGMPRPESNSFAGSGGGFVNGMMGTEMPGVSLGK